MFGKVAEKYRAGGRMQTEYAQKTDIMEFDEALVRKLIQQITVFQDHFTVEFKSGVSVDITE